MLLMTRFRHFGHGLLMGSADVVPGVSGGTVALIVGIYPRLIASIRTLSRGKVREVEWRLLLPLLAGIALALAVGSVVIPKLLDRYPAGTHAVFFGFIAASLPIPWAEIRTPRRSLWLLALVGALAAFVLVGLPPREIVDPALPLVFVSAMVAICAMILPGISGAFLLLTFGMYEVTLDALRDLDLVYVAVFGLGAAVGLAAFSRVLGYLLEHRHDATMAVLVGLMAGSLRLLWPWLDDDRLMLAPPGWSQALVALALAAIGYLLVHQLNRHSQP